MSATYEDVRRALSAGPAGSGGSKDCPSWSRSIEFSHKGRQLQLRTTAIGTTVQVWIFAADLPLLLHSVISLQQVVNAETSGQNLVGIVMQAIRSDVETGKLVLPNKPDPSEGAGTN